MIEMTRPKLYPPLALLAEAPPARHPAHRARPRAKLGLAYGAPHGDPRTMHAPDFSRPERGRLVARTAG